MKLQIFETNDFLELCYLLIDESTLETAVVDPGMMKEHKRNEVCDFIESKGLKVKYILLTHAHLDHAAAAEDLAKKYGVEVYANMSDAELAQNLPDQAMRFRLPVNLKPLKFDKFLNDGDILMLGDERIEVIATPGHSMGGLMYYVPDSGFACVGDTIFQGSIGRTDLPGGDFYTLIESIKEKVFALPDETVLFSGHGPSTTVLREKQMNPYVR